MSNRRRAVTIGFLALTAAGPSTAPTTVPTTRPTTAAAAKAADPTTTVRRATLRQSFEVDATFEPIDPVEVRFDLKRYAGELTVRKAAAANATVAKGDVLLVIDTDAIDRQIAATESAADVAHATVARAESDAALGERSDAAAMAYAKQAADDATAGLKRYDATDEPAVLASANLRAKQMTDALDDATDELDQLRQMYKSEDLTNKTADIVLKRAVHTRDAYEVMVRVSKALTDRALNYDPAVQRHAMAAGVAEQQLSVEQLAARQAQGRVVRAASLAGARAAAAAADRALAELKADRPKLTVTSPVDGTVVYGSFARKTWTAVNPKRLAVGEDVTPATVLMTVVQPGKLKVTAACPEAKLARLPVGTRVTVRPDAMPDLSYDATTGPPSPFAEGGRTGSFDVPVSLAGADVDRRLGPGYGATVEVDVPPATDVLVVPVSAVWHGKVWVRQSDGTDRPTPVTLGRRDGESVEVRSGVSVGDAVVTKPKGI